MKILSAMAVLAVGTSLWAGQAGHSTKRVVTACLNPGANARMMYRGQSTAAQILRQAGVQLKWRSAESACHAGNGILITVSFETPINQHPEALAYAKPFDRASSHIVLFYDRVLSAAGPALAPTLLGYVLAHEIVHILQVVDLHSESGVMRARWDSRDYFDMQRGTLKLSEQDIFRMGGGQD
jgi:hypothetical protein